MIENTIMIIFSIIVPLFMLKNVKNNCKDRKQLKDILEENKYDIITYIAMVIGFIIRLINLEKMPNGLIPDEASAGYEAFSILNYGTDRLGKSMPVFLISWGSGQNALYTYLLIPFIKLLGLTKFAIRLPMALISCISIITIYFLLKNIFNKKVATIGTIFFAICPWHIMKARYGLESNIYSIICSILYGIRHKKRKNESVLSWLGFFRNFHIFIWNIIFFCCNFYNYNSCIFIDKKKNKI